MNRHTRRPAAARALPVLLLGFALALAVFTYFQYLDGVGAAVSTLYPVNDRTNAGAYTNQASNACNGMISTVCSASLDDDVDAPIDADYIQSPADVISAQTEFDMLDAPVDMSMLTSLNVRYRAYKTGTKVATIRVELVNAETLAVIGVAPIHTLTTSVANYSYTLSPLTLTQAEADDIFVRITGTTSGVGTATRVVMTVVNLDTTHTTVAPNPVLPSTCGIDIALVADTSGSIDAVEMQDQKDAFNGFIDALLPGTPASMAVVDFDTDATVTQSFTNNATSLHTAVNNFSAGGLTNWEDAIRDARNLFPHRNDKPDLIIFASDGDPNTIGSNGGTSFVGEQAAVHAAITQADLAKNAGIRILALGIGTDPEVSNLESISSFDAVTTTNFSQLEQELYDLAVELCGGQISVHKLIDADGNPLTTGDQTSTAGWNFNANVTTMGDSSTPPSGMTDANGYIVFDINLGGDQTATVNIVESVQSGYALISASCMAVNNGPMGTWSGNAVNGITLGPADITLCTFVNSLQKTFTVQKDFQPNAPGSVTVSLSCASGIVAPSSAPASEATPASFTVTGYSGNPNCTATESPVPAGYDSSGTCSADLNTGICQVVNVLRTANITVNKDFQPNAPGDVAIALACSSGTVTAGDPTASEADPADFTVTGFNLGTTCNATEAVPPGYTGNQAGCATINIVPGGSHSCTIINILNVSNLTVYKDFDPDNFVTQVTITVTCTSGTVTPASAPAGEGSPASFQISGFTTPANCTATETAPPGYTGNATGCQNVAIMPGGNHSCTITNTAIQEPFTVYKDFSDNNPSAVTVSVSCTSGTVTPSSASVSEGAPYTFTVIAPVGDPTCTATESPVPVNYASSGTCGASLSTGNCTIVNTLNYPIVPFQVFKDFTDNNPAPVLITLACAPGMVQSVIDPDASEGDPADFTVELQPGTTCSASEAVPFGYTGNQSACQNVPVSAFQCTMVNSPQGPVVGGVVEVAVGANGGGALPGWLEVVLMALPVAVVGGWLALRPI
jgi:hypothetical protein